MRSERPRNISTIYELHRIENVAVGSQVIVYPLRGKFFYADIKRVDRTRQSGNPRVLVEAHIPDGKSFRRRNLSLGSGTAVMLLR